MESLSSQIQMSIILCNERKEGKKENEKFYASYCVCELYITKGGIRLIKWLKKN